MLFVNLKETTQGKASVTYFGIGAMIPATDISRHGV
jgi:hypothetical protein